jgi:hypothetical protein
VLKIIFTLDYEIHGNGEGSPLRLMVEPTERLLRLFESFGARLTIMADVAEILRFKAHANDTGRDCFHASRIESQLQRAIQRGHDVQLHLHSSYFNARWENGVWKQAWDEYDFAHLNQARMDLMVRQGKSYLESLLKPLDPAYRCHVFRAANWSVAPSKRVVETLAQHGLDIDTSVFKFGRRRGLVNFDYSTAESALLPWPVSAEDICRRDNNGSVWEFPIYSELRSLPAFITPQRIYRALSSRLHRFRVSAGPTHAAPSGTSVWRRLAACWGRHAWKADFNQCSGRQLVCALERAHRRYVVDAKPLPFVLIGHSKLFSSFNAWSLETFLAHVARQPDRFSFGRFSDFELRPLPNSSATPIRGGQACRPAQTVAEGIHEH